MPKSSKTIPKIEAGIFEAITTAIHLFPEQICINTLSKIALQSYDDLKRQLMVIDEIPFERDCISDLTIIPNLIFGMNSKSKSILFDDVGIYPGIKLSEPQVVSVIAHFLQEGGAHLQAKRIRSLIEALYTLTPDDKIGSDFYAPQVSTEVSTAIRSSKNNAKRVDLVISWNNHSSKKPFGIAVEFKISHSVTSGQLPSYKRYMSNNYDLKHLFLVVSEQTPRIKKVLNKNKNWVGVEWRSILRAWEHKIDPDIDTPDFARARQSIWANTYF